MKIKINGLVLDVQEGDNIYVETKDDFVEVTETIDHRRHEEFIASYVWHTEDGWKVATK